MIKNSQSISDQNFSNSKYGTEYNEYYQGPPYVFSDSEITPGDGAIDATQIKLPFSIMVLL